jgi:hypothetical protein
MPLFRRRRDSQRAPGMHAGVPGLAEYAASQGWWTLGEQPFDGHLEEHANDVAIAMYAAESEPDADDTAITAVHMSFRQAYGGQARGRRFAVANGWTSLFNHKPVAICAVELPVVPPVYCVQPRSFPPAFGAREQPTGDPDFDQRYAVQNVRPASGDAMLTQQVRARIMARDDWFFVGERHLLACMRRAAFRSAEEVRWQLSELLAIAEAVPVTR